MKNRFLFHQYCVAIFLLLNGIALHAQTDSWTNSTSGKWEDASSWSLGVPPGTNQDIMLTNVGVKVVTIGASTAETFPQTMNVNSITISSPADSGNILLLNCAGFQTPLTARQLTIGSNSTMLVYSSILKLIADDWFYVDGTLIQDADSQVSAVYPLYVDGRYDLHSGALNSPVQAIDHFGSFTQSGGTNSSSLTLNVQFYEPDESPEYNLSGGEFDGDITIRNGGTFDQSGGLVNATNGFRTDGNFIQSGGIFNAQTVQGPANVEEIPAFAIFLETGGTNREYNLALGLQLPAENYAAYNNQFEYDNCQGVPDSSGTYTLSNGLLTTSGTSITANGTFEQSGGENIVNGDLNVQGALYYTFMYIPPLGNESWFVGCAKVGAYSLTEGYLMASNLNVGISGSVFQSGGTNVITGNLDLYGSGNSAGAAYGGSYDLAGGVLIVSNLVNTGGLFQTGGKFVVGDFSGGFIQTGGSITQTGLLTMWTGMQVAAGKQQFGSVQLGAGSWLILPTGGCVVRYADSSANAWPSNLNFIVQNWYGSLYGGGNQQIIFGNNSAALTPQQLSQIQFQNPAGLPAGNYPSRILATGEIVPATGAPLPMKMTLTCCPTNAAMQLNLCGDIGERYAIEVSTDLVNWTWWTNQYNSNGTMCIFDCATNSPQKFYRAHLTQ